MELIDISYLNGSQIVNEYPHLKKAKVAKFFDKIRRNEDGSFVLKGSHPKYFAINIEDGRKKVFTNPEKQYCKVGQKPKSDGCAPWNGDEEFGELLFQPGPNKNKGNVEIIYWNDVVKPQRSKWPLLLIILLLWKLLSS